MGLTSLSDNLIEMRDFALHEKFVFVRNAQPQQIK